MARWLSGQSARTVCERSWIRVPVGPCAFSSPVTFGGSVWVRARAASSKETVSSVPAWFRADSGTNLTKQGEIVNERPYSSVAQWSECAHGMREVLGSSPGRVMCFFLPCDTPSIMALPLGETVMKCILYLNLFVSLEHLLTLVPSDVVAKP